MTDFERITEMLKKADIGFSIVPIRGCEGFKSIEANNGSFGEKISFDFDNNGKLIELYS